MPERFHRRSIRLNGYDYTRAGAYYVTACTQERAHMFGDVADGMMLPNAMGTVVQRCWDAIPGHMPMVVCDAFVVMPNHVHGIIVITDMVASDDAMAGGWSVGAGNFRPVQPPVPPADMITPPDNAKRIMPVMQKGSLGHIMQTFKAAVSRQVVRDGLMPRGAPIWQRGYYEHIIRDGDAHDRIAQYIVENPANWKGDRFNQGP